MTATVHEDVEALVDDIVDRLGKSLTIGTPLGIGKANHVLNELVARALRDTTYELEIWTALTLSRPTGDSELERRLVEPLADRLFDGYPDPEYDRLLKRGKLPDNITIKEFYLQPGQYLGIPEAQQNYHSVNYTHALQAFKAAEPDLVLQLVGKDTIDGDLYYNIGSNTDLSSDLIDWLIDRRTAGDRDIMIVGEVNRNMPFMYGDAPIEPEKFDAVLDNEDYDFSLFGPPKEPVSLADHAIALHVSALVRDGGTLQIGIGSLGEAIAAALELRHCANDQYRDIVDALGIHEQSGEVVSELGGFDPFEDGLYGATEMFVEGFLHLFTNDILTREVYHDEGIQRLVTDGPLAAAPDETLTPETGAEVLEFLLTDGAIESPLTESDVAYLQEYGILDADVRIEDGTLEIEGEQVPATIADPDARAPIVEHGLGDGLTGGQVLDGAFFLGSQDFYEGLRALSEQERRKLTMRSVQFTNALYGEETLKRLQRPDARFVNTGMKATLTGGVVSDGTADGRVVSGVGGQFNFVNQAQELADGRSIIMIRATRESGGDVESNIVWNYGHLTIPRHLRDIVVTEYGIADLHGKSDAEVIAELIRIADSRFQDELIETAKANGKLPAEWELPATARNNYPETLERKIGQYYGTSLERFPFGTDLTDEELGLGKALRNLQSTIQGRNVRDLADLETLRKTVQVPPAAHPYLERMDLEEPTSLQERAYRRVVVAALAEADVI